MSSMALDGTEPRSRSTDPITSVDAGRATNTVSSREQVLALMKQGGEWTQGELEQILAYRPWTPQRIRTAVSELKKRGLVEKTGATRETRHRRKAELYRVVAE